MACLADRVRVGATGVVLFAAALCVSGKAYAAGAAYQVDTAEVSSVGSCKVESWVSSADNRDFIGAVAPACVVDLFRAVELSAQFNRTRSDDEWTTAATPKIKTNIIPSAIGSWGVALAATFSYDFISREITTYSAYVPATLRLSEVVRINVNLGWQLDRTTNQHYFTYGLGFDWRTPDNIWTLTGEVFGSWARRRRRHRWRRASSSGCATGRWTASTST